MTLQQLGKLAFSLQILNANNDLLLVLFRGIPNEKL